MNHLEALLQGIISDPRSEDRWLILADFLEEHDDARRAELLRLHRLLLRTCCEPHLHSRRGPHERLVELLAQGVKPCVPQKTVMLADDIEMTFSFIPPGRFRIGSPPYEEGRRKDEDQKPLTIAKGFWMGVYPVTQSQWQAVMANTPSRFLGQHRPVEQVSWDDCQAFCKRLVARTDHYFSLPTETEWEYACRAGTHTAYHTGDNVEHLKRAGWCSSDSTRPVGEFPPNAWGLYDLHGNVFEWCEDMHLWYFASDGPRSRVLRGGAWSSDPDHCRSARRHSKLAGHRGDDIGFRIVLGPD